MKRKDEKRRIEEVKKRKGASSKLISLLGNRVQPTSGFLFFPFSAFLLHLPAGVSMKPCSQQ